MRDGMMDYFPSGEGRRNFCKKKIVNKMSLLCWLAIKQNFNRLFLGRMKTTLDQIALNDYNTHLWTLKRDESSTIEPQHHLEYIP